MCNYIYKELSCRHHYHLVESWCPKYIETERRCPPTIVTTCRERQQPCHHPWAKLIRGRNQECRPLSNFQPE
ncbi:hypothetical protein B0T10DRAFT_531614 [Thelonectria olida]|uniref:Uncharacterized protein n=1 Tax=Thelonectria olida TaxID=1576542 RepID=A0A9P8VXF3_9HYPO|nr:hypothetical protein B0T10DRAFT_531614 [Thelonectria olida]